MQYKRRDLKGIPRRTPDSTVVLLSLYLLQQYIRINLKPCPSITSFLSFHFSRSHHQCISKAQLMNALSLSSL